MATRVWHVSLGYNITNVTQGNGSTWDAAPTYGYCEYVNGVGTGAVQSQLPQPDNDDIVNVFIYNRANPSTVTDNPPSLTASTTSHDFPFSQWPYWFNSTNQTSGLTGACLDNMSPVATGSSVYSFNTSLALTVVSVGLKYSAVFEDTFPCWQVSATNARNTQYPFTAFNTTGGEESFSIVTQFNVSVSGITGGLNFGVDPVMIVKP